MNFMYELVLIWSFRCCVMKMSRQWMYDDRCSPQFVNGVRTFLLAAEANKGNTYSTVLHHPLLFGDKNPMQFTSSRKNFWRRCRGDIINITKYLHSQLLPLHLLYLPFASRFHLPLFEFFFTKIFAFSFANFICLFSFAI